MEKPPKDIFKIHETAKIRSGKYAGLVGTVTDTKESTIRVHIFGVVNDEPLDVQVWVKRSAVVRNHE